MIRLVRAALVLSAVLDSGVALALDDPALATPEVMAQSQAACRAQPYSILVTVRNIKDTKGVLTIDLQGSAATFLKRGGRIGRERIPAIKGETQACVPVARPGRYAVVVYQDRNLNFIFDKGLFGLPAEPYGVSRDPSLFFGPPNFEEAAIQVDHPLTPVTVTLHN